MASWVMRHPLLVKIGSAGLAGGLLLGGIIAGVHQVPSGAGQNEGGDTQQLVAHVQGSRHSVIGVVRAIGPSGFLVRNPNGVVFAVRWGPDSRFRAAGREIRPGALHVGDRVLVLGSPGGDGTLHASVTTITARPGGRLPAVPAPANGGTASSSAAGGGAVDGSRP